MILEIEAAETRVFRAAAGLRVRSWGDSSDVAYLESTRNTHLVDRNASVILQALLAAGGRATALQVWTALQPESATPPAQDEQPDAEELAALAGWLQVLADAGLVI